MNLSKTEKQVWILLAVYTLILQLLLNQDSYLYATCRHYDSSVFFMCGKAMMNGLTPYVDFADSKGPLLWLLFGIGYLIDHTSYVGVFWIVFIFYWLTLCMAYRTAALYLPKAEALLAAMMMAVPYFYWNFYTETKAEHFCMLPIAGAIYVLLKSIKKGSGEVSKSGYAWIGAGFMACLLMKWSVAVMMLALLTSIGVWAWKRRDLSRYVTYTGIGMLTLAVPFAIYMGIVGNFNDFISEYFSNTLKSVSVPFSETLSVYLSEWICLLTTKRIVFVLFVLPWLLLWNKREWWATSLPFLSGVFFIALGIRHDNFGHYITVVTPFAVFAVIKMIKWGKKCGANVCAYSLLLSVALLYIIGGRIYYSDIFFAKAQTSRLATDFERIGYYMVQVSEPTILNIGQETGFAMGYTLPYCRYWITQMGRTQQMLDAQLASLNEGNADFVALHGDGVVDEYEKTVLGLGYHYLDSYGDTKIYTKHSVDAAPDDFKVTKLDILLKRDVLYETAVQAK